MDHEEQECGNIEFSDTLLSSLQSITIGKDDFKRNFCSIITAFIMKI